MSISICVGYFGPIVLHFLEPLAGNIPGLLTYFDLKQYNAGPLRSILFFEICILNSYF